MTDNYEYNKEYMCKNPEIKLSKHIDLLIVSGTAWGIKNIKFMMNECINTEPYESFIKNYPNIKNHYDISFKLCVLHNGTIFKTYNLGCGYDNDEQRFYIQIPIESTNDYELITLEKIKFYDEDITNLVHEQYNILLQDYVEIHRNASKDD